MNKKTVLIIEDEPALVEMYQKKFKDAKYTVYTAGDGITAEKLALEKKPSAILIDLFIPQKDGIALLESLRPNYRIQSLLSPPILTSQAKKPKPAQKAPTASY